MNTCSHLVYSEEKNKSDTILFQVDLKLCRYSSNSSFHIFLYVMENNCISHNTWCLHKMCKTTKSIQRHLPCLLFQCFTVHQFRKPEASCTMQTLTGFLSVINCIAEWQQQQKVSRAILQVWKSLLFLQMRTLTSDKELGWLKQKGRRGQKKEGGAKEKSAFSLQRHTAFVSLFRYSSAIHLFWNQQ